jgi:hypothetical protein
MAKATWKAHEKHGRLTMQSDLPDTVYAFPKQRKEPLTDAQHVRNAVARFDQVIDVSHADRALAFANIEKAAKPTRSTFRRHHGTTLAFILNGTGKRLQRRRDERALVAQKRGTKLVRDRDLEWRWETKLLSSERWYRRFYKRLSLFSVAGTSNSVGPSWREHEINGAVQAT